MKIYEIATLLQQNIVQGADKFTPFFNIFLAVFEFFETTSLLQKLLQKYDWKMYRKLLQKHF